MNSILSVQNLQITKLIYSASSPEEKSLNINSCNVGDYRYNMDGLLIFLTENLLY